MPDNDTPRSLPPFTLARTLYGEVLDAQSGPEIAHAMRYWKTLKPHEQSFITAHLLYLTLHCNAVQGTYLRRAQSSLGDAVELLDELRTTLEEGRPMSEDDSPEDDSVDEGELEQGSEGFDSEAQTGSFMDTDRDGPAGEDPERDVDLEVRARRVLPPMLASMLEPQDETTTEGA